MFAHAEIGHFAQFAGIQWDCQLDPTKIKGSGHYSESYERSLEYILTTQTCQASRRNVRSAEEMSKVVHKYLQTKMLLREIDTSCLE